MQTPPDPWQILSWKAAIITVLLAAAAALAKGIWALWQQSRDFRWKQAELGRELLDKWFSWQGSNSALRMIDEGSGTYTLDGYGKHSVDPEIDIPRALAIIGTTDHWETFSDSEKDRFIRKCFDVLFYQFERVQHSIEISVVKRSDILTPAEYYVEQLARYYGSVSMYLRYAGFARARVCMQSGVTRRV